MTLTYHGVTHDTDAMEEFRTGDDDLPPIYMTRLVFIVRRNAIGEPHALRVYEALGARAAQPTRSSQADSAQQCRD